jgi:hypothetical protein
MRKMFFTTAAIGMVAFFTASTASAQCNFNMPGKAKGLKSDMARAYIPCGSGITFSTPNTASNAGTPACSPPTTYSTFQFSEKGKCSVKSSAKAEQPCKTGTPGDCSNVTLQAKCSGVVNQDGQTPISGPGWLLNTLARATTDDKANSDQTIIDFPASFKFPDASKGKLKLKSDTHTLLALLFGPGNELSVCTQLETLQVRIVDPLNRPFANIGSSTRAK